MTEEGTPGGGLGESSRIAGLSRRGFLASGVALGSGAAIGAAAAGGLDRLGGGHPEGTADLLLTNGEIHTMDGADTVVSAVAIKDNRFLAVGDEAGSSTDGDTEVIDLDGHVALPGLIDAHSHFAQLGQRAGYHTPLETAFSIDEVQEILAERREDVPEGRFITTIGGFHPMQFDEGRPPTLDELDAAVSDRPVFLLHTDFRGPAVTNSLGKAELEDAGVEVDDDGTVAAGQATAGALLELRSRCSCDDRLRTTREAQAYSTSLGLTAHLDQSSFPATGDPDEDGAAHYDRYSLHDQLIELHRRDELDVRIQYNHINVEQDPQVPELREYLRNVQPLHGDAMLSTGGIGEFTAGDPFELLQPPQEPSEAWEVGTKLIAQEGWRNEESALEGNAYQPIVDYWEEVHADVGIDGLRWALSLANFINEEYVEKLDDMGAGLISTGMNYFSTDGPVAGPNFPMLLRADAKVGYCSDGVTISPLNPWLHVYYAATGRNAAGDVVNEGNGIPRKEILRMYTAENAWFIHQEDQLGTIEPGNLADVAVLSDDVFAVDDEALRDVTAALTIVDGDVVHDDGTLA